MKDSRGKNINLIFLILLFSAIVFFVGEISLRAYHRVKRGIPFTMSPMTFYDKEFGWRGKKVFGDIVSKKYKIFFIGDSFTYGLGVPEEDMYYNVVKKDLDAEVYVYAAPGYGTLQEYLVIDRYLEKIKPDLIVLQVISNDFISNSWDLQKMSLYHNLLMVCPYLIDGKVEFRFPKPWGRFRMTLSTYSRIFYSLSNRFDILFAVLAGRGKLTSVENIIKKEGMDFEPFKKSVIITNALIEKIKKRVKGTPFFAFSADCDEPYTEQFRKIFTTNGIDFIESAYRSVEEARGRGEKVVFPNNHWNSLGNLIVGTALSDEIRKRGYLRESDGQRY